MLLQHSRVGFVQKCSNVENIYCTTQDGLETIIEHHTITVCVTICSNCLFKTNLTYGHTIWIISEEKRILAFEIGTLSRARAFSVLI